MGSMITNDAKCRREIKYGIVMVKAAFNKRKGPVTSKLDVNLREKLVKCCICSIGLCSADTWRVRKLGHK